MGGGLGAGSSTPPLRPLSPHRRPLPHTLPRFNRLSPGPFPPSPASSPAGSSTPLSGPFPPHRRPLPHTLPRFNRLSPGPFPSVAGLFPTPPLTPRLVQARFVDEHRLLAVLTVPQTRDANDKRQTRRTDTQIHVARVALRTFSVRDCRQLRQVSLSAHVFHTANFNHSYPRTNLHQPGIEPRSHRWQRCILPLDH